MCVWERSMEGIRGILGMQWPSITERSRYVFYLKTGWCKLFSLWICRCLVLSLWCFMNCGKQETMLSMVSRCRRNLVRQQKWCITLCYLAGKFASWSFSSSAKTYSLMEFLSAGDKRCTVVSWTCWILYVESGYGPSRSREEFFSKEIDRPVHVLLVQEVKLHHSCFADCTFTCCSRSVNTCAHALAKVGRKGTNKFICIATTLCAW